MFDESAPLLPCSLQVRQDWANVNFIDLIAPFLLHRLESGMVDGLGNQ